MSHSTTATSTYPLLKYSKSYPTGPQPNPEAPLAEWQHFTNPSIRLVLDIRKGAELEGVRLRILWSMDSGNSAEQREVVFASEDVDLLTLSCLPLRPTQKQQAQGLPLKAVYRDTVVGIRYLHPINSDGPPMYRRFQITFLSSNSVMEFINAISTVCPCKANPNTNPPVVPRTMNPPSHPVLLGAQNSQAPHLGTPSIVAQSLSMAQPPRIDPPSSSPNYAFQTSAHSNAYTSSPLRIETSDFSVPLSAASRLIPQQSTFPTLNDTLNGPYSQHSQALANPQLEHLQQQASLPSSSPPTSSAKSVCTCSVHPTSIAAGAPVLDPGSAMLASLRESTSLYDLPPDALEKLVSDVVREDGFVKLLENLGTMWGVKSFVGI